MGTVDGQAQPGCPESPGSSIGSGISGLVKYGRKFIHVTGAIIVFLIIWQFAPNLGLINPIIIPVPTTILGKMIQLTLSGELITNIAISVGRVLVGFFIALAVALPLGFLLGGWFKSFETAVNPLLAGTGPGKPVHSLPVFITLLGIGELSKISIIFWVCQWPVLFNTVTGIRNVDPVLVKMAKSLGIGKFQMFKKVLLPGSDAVRLYRDTHERGLCVFHAYRSRDDWCQFRSRLHDPPGTGHIPDAQDVGRYRDSCLPWHPVQLGPPPDREEILGWKEEIVM